MLLDTYWIEYGGGTSFQEVLRYARQVLARQGSTKQIIMVTDGEPTTHNRWSRDDTRWGDYRRGSGVLEETLREVGRCTRNKITINTFMLGHNPAPLDFVRLMAETNRGRAFVADPERLGTYAVADYVNMRNMVIR